MKGFLERDRSLLGRNIKISQLLMNKVKLVRFWQIYKVFRISKKKCKVNLMTCKFNFKNLNLNKLHNMNN